MQSRRLDTSFEGLNNSIAQSPGELWSCKVAQKYRLNDGQMTCYGRYPCCSCCCAKE